MTDAKQPTARELAVRARIAAGHDAAQAEAIQKRQEESDAAEAAAAAKAKAAKAEKK